MKIDKFNIGMRGHDLSDSFEGMCKTAVDTDIRHIQFAPAKTMTDIDFKTVGYADSVAEKMVSAFTSCNIKIPVLGCYIDPITESTLESQLGLFESFISYADAVGATVIGTETGNLATIDETRSENNFNAFLNNLERLLKTAEDRKVCIGIEPVWVHTVYSIEMMRRVLDCFKSEYLKVILDPVNLINAENHTHCREIVDEAFDILGDKISVIHLKDYQAEGLKRVPVGTGIFDVKHCLDNAAKLSVVPDVMLDEMPLANLEGVTERLKKILL